MLSDLTSGRHLWADRWEGDADDVCAFKSRVASGVAMAVEQDTARRSSGSAAGIPL